MLAKFGTNASGILFSWRDTSSYRLYTLGPLCLWQCLCNILQISDITRRYLVVISFRKYITPYSQSDLQTPMEAMSNLKCVSDDASIRRLPCTFMIKKDLTSASCLASAVALISYFWLAFVSIWLHPSVSECQQNQAKLIFAADIFKKHCQRHKGPSRALIL